MPNFRHPVDSFWKILLVLSIEKHFHRVDGEHLSANDRVECIFKLGQLERVAEVVTDAVGDHGQWQLLAVLSHEHSVDDVVGTNVVASSHKQTVFVDVAFVDEVKHLKRRSELGHLEGDKFSAEACFDLRPILLARDGVVEDADRLVVD